MNIAERTKLVKAMEFIARQINDEEVFDRWLMVGVADGDIEYGDLSEKEIDPIYLYDDNFREIMTCFTTRMMGAYTSGGLFCDGVLSESLDQ